jgi:hypothetical protein
MRELVMSTPRQFLSQEIFNSCRLDNLRKLRAVSKSVWQKENFNAFAKFFLGKSLPIEELPDHRFTRRDVSIKLNPGSSDNLESPALDRFLYSLKGIRIVLL